jgi:hypothetical protein
MANARWRADRERRNKLAALTAEQYPARIVRRIVVSALGETSPGGGIDDEQTVREATFWNWESGRDWRRKERAVLNKETRKSGGGAAAPPYHESKSQAL